MHEDASPLDLMKAVAPLVSREHHERYREIFETLANTSGLMNSDDDVERYNDKIAAARHDLIEILRGTRGLHPDNSSVQALLAYYEARTPNS